MLTSCCKGHEFDVFMCLEQTQNSSKSRSEYINTFGNSHTTFCPLPRFCLFPISFLWHLCHVSCLQAGGEILKALDCGALGPLDGVGWNCGKDRGRKRKSQTGNPKPLVEFSIYLFTPPPGRSERVHVAQYPFHFTGKMLYWMCVAFYLFFLSNSFPKIHNFVIVYSSWCWFIWLEHKKKLFCWISLLILFQWKWMGTWALFVFLFFSTINVLHDLQYTF